MATIDIRQVHADELLELSLTVQGYAFEPSPPAPNRDQWQEMLSYLGDSIIYVLFEDGQPMAMAACGPVTQNIRGTISPMGAIWGVATHPAGRRKGYARQIMIRLFAAAREAGMPVSMLYAFRESFYERLGYAIFPQPRLARFSALTLSPLLKMDLGGCVRLYSIQEGFETYYAYLSNLQQRVHGLAVRSGKNAQRMRDENAVWLAVAQVNGEPVGIMAYRIEKIDGPLSVSRFWYSTSQGRYLLLEWLARHADQVKDIELTLPPAEHPETWLADMNVQFSSLEAPLGRILDVAGLSGKMQTGPGRFSARILDPQCPWNEGQMTFETRNGLLEIAPAEDAACDLTINGLSALIYGTHDPDDFAMRRWGNPSVEVQAVMRAIFPPRLPYLQEHF